MKLRSILTLVLCAFQLISIAQIEVGNKKPKCYERSNAGKRFVEWDCGKVVGIIDCNEKLDYDEGSNTILSKSSGSAFTGKCESCYQNGVLERRMNFVNGKEEGADTTYYSSSCLMVTRNHIYGKEEGLWTYYYDSTTNVAWMMNYKNGLKHGQQVFFNRKGDTTSFENYTAGNLNGVKRTYFDSSKVEKQVVYKNGLIDGQFITYNRAGKPLQSVTYKAGKKNGVATYYYDDGTLLRTENWLMDVKNGEFKTLYYEGFVQIIENYKKGQKEGWFEERYFDQKLKRRALYKKDVLIEEHVYDIYGKEISTFGGESSKDVEDDAMPTTDAKPKKAKKEKKVKEPKAPKKSKK